MRLGDTLAVLDDEERGKDGMAPFSTKEPRS
jgi:hypothetical protein